MGDQRNTGPNRFCVVAKFSTEIQWTFKISGGTKLRVLNIN